MLILLDSRYRFLCGGVVIIEKNRRGHSFSYQLENDRSYYPIDNRMKRNRVNDSVNKRMGVPGIVFWL